MLQSFSPSHCWGYDADVEPLLFDDEICQILMKDLHTLPTPPQSPPMKTGLDKPLSKVDQLEFVSELLLEEDFLQLNWNCDLLRKDGYSETDSLKDQRPEVSDDCLWNCLSDKFTEKLSGPLLSDIDTSIFQEIAGSTLDCHSAALLCQNEDLSKQTESSDSSSLSATSDCTASESSASDSEEEIDVVTVKRRGHPAHQGEVSRRSRPSATKRCFLEIQQDIQLQHNYAAPPPPSPRRAEAPKRARADHRSRHHPAALAVAPGDPEDEEERRRTHNVMERQRRNELKNCFLRLRDHVPELSHNDKASKVQILKKARDGIRGLEAETLRLGARRDRLKRRQDQLKARLEQLRR
ncbi:myelocytomatosis oncogene homolog [Conger conger]|uniref:myelocytomatosis oncogene homolog n=1 Tax=Conger conger TaxID=82655 RepID=UPI002A59D9BC|nr:myelocytomatosis oncogene homolog [Conger conger]XP_061075816.1 myelocytomatosis oncogene homolog [Conger conger]